MKKLPLTPSDIKEILEYKERPLIKVDYEASEIKGQFFLNYIANLKLNIDLYFGGELDLELLKLYTSNKYQLNIPYLNMCFAQILLDIKEIEFESCFNRVISKEQSWNFYNANQDAVEELIRFLDSLLFSTPFVNNQYKETVGETLIESGVMELIDDDKLNFSLNAVRVLEIDDFVPLYFSGDIKTKPAYYKAQMEGNFYHGNSFFNYLAKTDNPLMILCKGIMEGWITSEDYLKATGAKKCFT